MEEFCYTQENPWKGLFAYREGEILYGRDNDIRDLTQYVLRDKYTLLYGKSGIGKSSILNAAVIPALRRHGFIPIVLRFSHKSENYIDQIKKAINEVLGADCIHEELPQKGKNETLYEYFHRHTFWDIEGKRVKIFLMFDQFEEIFTLQSDESKKKDFFVQLAAQCNDIRPDYLQASCPHSEALITEQLVNHNNTSCEGLLDDFEFELPDLDSIDYIEDNEVRMIFTIREDFLSEFDYYASSIPSFRNNRYFLRPINEEQAAQIIMRPCPGLVNDKDAWLIISKVTKREDFNLDGNPELTVDSAVLSLYLSRLFDARPDNGTITKSLIEQKGGEIISEFYKDAISSVSQSTADYLEESLLTGQGRRDNITVYDAKNDGHITEEELHTLVDEKKILRCFNYAGDLRIEFVHDILCDVAAAHKEERMREIQQESERKKNIIEQERIKNELESLNKRNKKLVNIVTIIFLFLGVMAVVLWDGLYHNIEIRYGIVIKKNGWFEGLEEITEEESTYRNYHFVFMYKGRWAKHPYKMEIRDGYGKLTTDHDMEAYILSKYDETDNGADSSMVERLRTACQWEFVCNANSDFVVQERALDRKGSLVFSYNRSAINDSTVLGTYNDEYGFPLMMRDSTYFFLRTTFDKRGYEVLMDFFDDQGRPITNRDSVYQTKKSYLDNGLETASLSCFLDGNYTMDRFGNCGMIARGFTSDSLRVTEYISVDNEMCPCRVKGDSIVIYKIKYDEHGRGVEISYWNENDNPDVSNLGIHAQKIEYNRHGKITRLSFFDRENNRCGRNDGLLEIRKDYDEWGNEIYYEEVYDTLCYIWRHQYVKDTVLTMEENLTIFGGDTNYLYRFYYDIDKRVETEIVEGLISKTYYDKKKSIIRENLYNENNILIVSRTATYQYNKDKTYYIELQFDADSILLEKKEYLIDSSINTISCLTYSSEGEFINGKKEKYDDLKKSEDKRILVSQESIGEDWLTKRLYKNASQDGFYYRKKFIHSIKPSLFNKVVGLYAENEFCRPSLICDWTGAYYAYLLTSAGIKYFDEKGKEIIPQNDKWNYIGYIETLKKDTTLGFKNGDIILSCNKWDMAFYIWPDIAFLDFPFDKKLERAFLVARFNHQSAEYDTVSILVPPNTELDRYIEINKMRCTTYEEHAVQLMLNKYVRQPMIKATPFDESHYAFKHGLRSSVLILKWNNWSFSTDKTEDFGEVLEASRKKHKTIVYFDCDNKRIGTLETDLDTIGLYIQDTIIRPYLFDMISGYYKEWSKRDR